MSDDIFRDEGNEPETFARIESGEFKLHPQTWAALLSQAPLWPKKGDRRFSTSKSKPTLMAVSSKGVRTPPSTPPDSTSLLQSKPMPQIAPSRGQRSVTPSGTKTESHNDRGQSPRCSPRRLSPATISQRRSDVGMGGHPLMASPDQQQPTVSRRRSDVGMGGHPLMASPDQQPHQSQLKNFLRRRHSLADLGQQDTPVSPRNRRRDAVSSVSPRMRKKGSEGGDSPVERRKNDSGSKLPLVNEHNPHKNSPLSSDTKALTQTGRGWKSLQGAMKDGKIGWTSILHRVHAREGQEAPDNASESSASPGGRRYGRRERGPPPPLNEMKEEEEEEKDKDDEARQEEEKRNVVVRFALTIPAAKLRYEGDYAVESERSRLQMVFERFTLESEMSHDCLYAALIHLGFLTVTEESCLELAQKMYGVQAMDFPDFTEFVGELQAKEKQIVSEAVEAYLAQGQGEAGSLDALRVFLQTCGVYLDEQSIRQALVSVLPDAYLNDFTDLTREQILGVLACCRANEGFGIEELDQAREIFDKLHQEDDLVRRGFMDEAIKVASVRDGMTMFFSIYSMRHFQPLMKDVPNETERTQGVCFYEFLVWLRRLRDLDVQEMWEVFCQADHKKTGRIYVPGLMDMASHFGFTLIADVVDEILTEIDKSRDLPLDFGAAVRFIKTCREKHGFGREELQQHVSDFNKFALGESQSADPDERPETAQSATGKRRSNSPPSPCSSDTGSLARSRTQSPRKAGVGRMARVASGLNLELELPKTIAEDDEEPVLDARQVLDLLRYMGLTVRVDEVYALIDEVDFNKNGSMEVDEFLMLMRLMREKELTLARRAFNKLRGRQPGLPPQMLEEALTVVMEKRPQKEVMDQMQGIISSQLMNFDSFWATATKCRLRMTILGRKRANFEDDVFNQIGDVFKGVGMEMRQSIPVGEFIFMLSESNLKVNTADGRKDVFRRLSTAREDARSSGVPVDEVGDNEQVSFFACVHFIRGIVREVESAAITRENDAITSCRFSTNDAAELRHVFMEIARSKDKARRRNLGDLLDFLTTLPSIREQDVMKMLRSIGMSISLTQLMELGTQIQDARSSMGIEDDDKKVDFVVFLKLIRWMLDTNYAGVNKAAEKRASQASSGPGSPLGNKATQFDKITEEVIEGFDLMRSLANKDGIGFTVRATGRMSRGSRLLKTNP